MLQLSLFGSMGVRISTSDQTWDITLPARPAAVLAFLALGQGRFFSRGQIIQSLGGDNADATSTGSFNTALWRLRKTLERAPAQSGDFIVCNRQGAIGLNGAGPVWVDAKEFLTLTEPGVSKPLLKATETDQRDMVRGVALYTADILPDSADPWLLGERERYRRLYLNALGRLMELHALHRDYESAVHYAQKILDADPLREDVHRELMRLYVMSGRRALALRQYEICREALKRELAIQPMRDTKLLYRQIADAAVEGREALGSELLPACPEQSVAQRAHAAADPAVFQSRDASPVDHIAIALDLIAQADHHLRLSLVRSDQSTW